MRLDRVFIDGYKNLNGVEVDFDESKLATVIIGQNGTGKSNLIEAIVDVFRFVDMNRGKPRFTYSVDYRIGDNEVCLSNKSGKALITVNGRRLSRKAFDESRYEYFPDLVFGYYSGKGRKLESLFDSHQRRYYDAIKRNDNAEECEKAKVERRLFYCRQIHGELALLSFFAFPNPAVSRLLKEQVGVTCFDSALGLFREPWFAKGGKEKKIEEAGDFWGAKGPAGAIAKHFKEHAFYPMALSGNAIDDYRDKQQTEAQYACFLKGKEALKQLASGYRDDEDLFYALEAADISDLIRKVQLWVGRVDDSSGDVGFTDLSDGEQQLLMVLGLLRVSRGKRALFLLDEPDTHLNPAWQHDYLQLIQEWTEEAAESNNCHVVLTSHNPLTISALERSEVRVLEKEAGGKVRAAIPYVDPRGMGFTATLTEIFGLTTTLDHKTQTLLDSRNALARKNERSTAEEQELIELNDKLNRLGFMNESREPLYQDFLRAWQDVRYAERAPLTQELIAKRQAAMAAMIKDLMSEEKAD